MAVTVGDIDSYFLCTGRQSGNHSLARCAIVHQMHSPLSRSLLGKGCRIDILLVADNGNGKGIFGCHGKLFQIEEALSRTQRPC